ncbi:MAG: nicotinamide mononucleotide transporter [Cyclobacteriaceae bacterium]
MNDLWAVFIEQLLATSWFEGIAVFFGLASVWYSKQEHIWVYPTGIISVLIYVYICFSYKLYADMGINGYYFVMSVYGWYHWTDTDGTKPQIPISINNRQENIISALIMISSFLLIRFGLDFTDTDVPTWDSMTTATAITGMWLMARKKIENWLAWIITDIISVPLYLYKGLPLTSFQFLIFTGLAIWGYQSWKTKYRRSLIS